MNTIKFKCFEVHQPIGTFYIGVMNHNDLIRLSHTDVRRLEEQKGDIEKYTGLQRRLSPTRTKEISKYVNLVDATFPSSVILHAKEEDVDYDSDKKLMLIKNRADVLQVLDGQHRISGLKNCKYPDNGFQINVTLFVGMELEDQAIIFATINKTQTKVNKSLVADLFEFAKLRSPQKTAHNIARALNEKEGSPFHDKIKILGTANDARKETITQATFVKSLMDYISRDEMTDRDIYKRGKIPQLVDNSKEKKLFFRNLFINEKDTDIAQILWNYFSAVQDKWPGAWNNVEVNMILNKSTGFVALMKFLRDAYLSFDNIGVIIGKKDFDEIFARINMVEDDFNKQKYVPGGIGQSALYKDLLAGSGIKSK